MSRLDVMYACDNKYAPYCGVSMTSLLINNTGINEIRVLVVCDNVSDENKRRFSLTALRFNCKLKMVDAKEIKKLVLKLGIPTYRDSFAANYRLFFRLFVPDDAENLLYLDSDTLVVGSLEELLNYSLGGKSVAAVVDSLGGNYKKLLGFTSNEPYFNSGILWIDIKRWNSKDYLNRINHHLLEVRARYCNPDQDVINQVLKNDISILPIEYNFQPVHWAYSNRSYFFNYPREYYTADEIDKGRTKPLILHTYRFLGDFPWHKNNMHPNSALFDSYLDISEWSDYVKVPSESNLVFRLEKALYRLLPRSTFLFIFQKVTDSLLFFRNRKLEQQ